MKNIRLWDWVLFATIILAVLAMTGVDYVAGRSGDAGTWMMLDTPLFLLAAACVPLVIYRFGWNAFRRRIHRDYLVTLVCTAGLVAVFFIFLPAAKTYLWGFRDGLLARVSLEDIEEIASTVRATLPPDGFLPSPRKTSLWDEQRDRATWTKVALACPIEKLDPACVLQSDVDGVAISWGGALEGHWGIRVSAAGTHRLGTDFSYLPINPRVGVYYTE